MRLVFDFGGVVFRWKPHELLQRMLPERGLDEVGARALAAVFFQGDGDAPWASFDRGTVSEDALVPRLAERTGIDAAAVRRIVDAVPDVLLPQPDTVAWIERLCAAGHPLHFLSNMPKPFSAHLLRTHEVLRRFASGVFSSDVLLIKPERAIYELAAGRFERAPGELVLLDDTAVNVEAAVANGWQAQQFTDAASCEAALQARGLLRQP